MANRYYLLRLFGVIAKSTRGDESGVSEVEREDREGEGGFGGLAGMYMLCDFFIWIVKRALALSLSLSLPL